MNKGIKIIDLSVPISSSTVPGLPPERELTYNAKIVHQDHRFGAEKMKKLFEAKDEDLQDRMGWASDELMLTSHAGTHVDAPWHYGPVCEGKRAKTIDEIPLEWFYGDGVVLDFRHKNRGSLISQEDVEKAISKIGCAVGAKNIVLLLTDGDKYIGSPDYVHKGIGMSRESTLFLVNKGVKVIGTDSPGFDRPFSEMAAEFKRTGDGSVIWQAHYAGKTREYCQIEKMANLDKLPTIGFKIACFPVKILRGSAAWVRAVAILEKGK